MVSAISTLAGNGCGLTLIDMVAAEERKIAERKSQAKGSSSDSKKAANAKDSQRAEKDA